MKTLADIKPGQTAKVIGIDDQCQGFERFRLLDLGVVPGTSISLALENPLRDPQAFLIRGAVIALRRDQTSKIKIRTSE